MSMNGVARPMEPDLQSALEANAVTPPTHVDLHPSALDEYFDRFGGKPSVAEVFHHESRLTSRRVEERVRTATLLDDVRTWTLGQERELRVIGAERTTDPIVMVARAAAATMGSNRYGVELVVVRAGGALTVLAEGDALAPLVAGPSAHNLIHDARVPDTWPAPHSGGFADARDSVGVLVFVGVPWRYMALLGARGYRRLLSECGRYNAAAIDAAGTAGLEWRLDMEFNDGKVDAALGLDGLERVSLAVMWLARGSRD